MSNVYRHISISPSEIIGHVDPDGKVYDSRFGPDRYVGRGDLENGLIFETQLGPEKEIGQVDLTDGKVFHFRSNPENPLGYVADNGKCYWHKTIVPDIYVGKVEDMLSFAHGGAAFLLLILPMIEEVKEEKEAKQKPTASDMGTVPDQA